MQPRYSKGKLKSKVTMNRTHLSKYILAFLVLATFSMCETENTLDGSSLDTELGISNVVIVVIDGPRHTETWGDLSHRHIPHQFALSEEGVLFTNFTNDGITFTLSGHTAITTGVYENVTNNGAELPSHPSIFQRYLKAKQLNPAEAQIITSKSKLHALGNTKDLNWYNSYLPLVNAKDRFDINTYEESIKLLNEQSPSLMLIHFKEPDTKGHQGDWNGYLQKIKESDEYVGKLWNYLQSHQHYKNNTLLLVTADHGRHLNGIGSGFVGHGDGCPGCRQIYLLALGPNLDKGKVVNTHYNQTDLAPTIATVLNFNWQGEGRAINDLLNLKK